MVGVLQFGRFDKLIHCRILIVRACRFGHTEGDVGLVAFAQRVAHVLDPLVLCCDARIFFPCYLLQLILKCVVLSRYLR